MEWSKLISYKRLGKETSHQGKLEFRTEFQRDYDRLIFSAPFRRMQNKTQVFPLPGSVFVHNRLTHSLEVSSVGRSLGNDAARELLKLHHSLDPEIMHSLGAIVSAACLAHDMGNPPFGHSGERAIASFFSEGDGSKLKDYKTETGDSLTSSQWNDIIHFEGNANAFRLLTHQFSGRRLGGFVMTYATLGSIVKYPYSSSSICDKKKFGFFESERSYFQKIAEEMGLICWENEGNKLSYARHPLVYLVEAADDICYEIMDIEDAHKLRLLSDDETFDLLFSFFDEHQRTCIEKAFDVVTDTNEKIVYLRSCVINELEHACVKVFVEHEEKLLQGQFQGSLIDHLPTLLVDAYKRCSNVAFKRIYRSKEVLDIDLSGYHIIYTLLEQMVKAVLNPKHAYSQLLISRVSSQYQLNAPTLYEKLMAVLDYVSGMTDVYALDFYRKIEGHSLPMV